MIAFAIVFVLAAIHSAYMTKRNQNIDSRIAMYWHTIMTIELSVSVSLLVVGLVK